ncbi:MAG: hypothetical protein EA377_09620 [Phycisphaerales bacterium]|nr:MAG: hypothetical protein EA377_09620 [Phycisphaerales bacterium]
MTWETAINVATLLSALAAAIGVIVSFLSFRKQMHARLFLHFTDRYEKVISEFPSDARGKRMLIDGEPPEPSEELNCAVLRYLNLCSEEFYLHDRGYLPTRIWNIWRKGLEATVCSPLLRREWKTLRQEYDPYPEFQRFIDGVQNIGDWRNSSKSGG